MRKQRLTALGGLSELLIAERHPHDAPDYTASIRIGPPPTRNEGLAEIERARAQAGEHRDRLRQAQAVGAMAAE